MSTLLKELKTTDISIQEKVKVYNDCNRKVAILCNHKRTVGAGHEVQMEKMSDRVRRLYFLFLASLTIVIDQGPAIPAMAPEANDSGYRSQAEEEERL
jgi:DNA topoisomerase I